MTLSRRARTVTALIDEFVARVPGVRHATVISPDGLLILMSGDLSRDDADQIAAVSSSLIGMASSTADLLAGETVTVAIVEMAQGFHLVLPLPDESILTVSAAPDSDLQTVRQEAKHVAAQAGELLNPALRAELQDALPL